MGRRFFVSDGLLFRSVLPQYNVKLIGAYVAIKPYNNKKTVLRMKSFVSLKGGLAAGLIISIIAGIACCCTGHWIIGGALLFPPAIGALYGLLLMLLVWMSADAGFRQDELFNCKPTSDYGRNIQRRHPFHATALPRAGVGL